MAELKTLADVVEASQGLLNVQGNFDYPDLPLTEVRHMVWSPHGRPTLAEEGDSFADWESVPNSAPTFKALLRSDRSGLGLPIVNYSFFRADGGANELAAEIGQGLAQRGENAIVMSPRRIVGRGVLDLNRPRGLSVGDRLFPMPELATKELHGIFDISNGVVLQLFQILAGHKLKSVIQPHTMASGDPTEEEMKELAALAKEVSDSLKPGSAEFDDPEKVRALIAKWEIVYANMNNRRNRVGVDLVNAVQDDPKDTSKLAKIDDQGLSARVAENFSQRGVPNVDNVPFAHIRGYPGSDLAILAGERGFQQVCFDVPRHLLMIDQNRKYRPLTFQPDADPVKLIAAAVVEAIR